MAKKLSEIKIIDGTTYKKCLYKLHIGDRYVPIHLMKVHTSRLDGYDTICKECTKIAYRERYAKYGDLIRENKKIQSRISRNYKTLEWHLFRSVTRNARENGLPFDLELKDIIIPDVCPILNIPLIKTPISFVEDNITKYPNYPSVDRLIPELGYVKTNITIVSFRANKLKSNASLQEINAICRWMNNKFDITK